MVTVQGKVLFVGQLQTRQGMNGPFNICPFDITQGQTQYGTDMNGQPLMHEERWTLEATFENAQIASQLQLGQSVSVDVMSTGNNTYRNRHKVVAIRVEGAQQPGASAAGYQQQYAAPVPPASAGGYQQTAPTPAFQQPGMYNQQQAPY